MQTIIDIPEDILKRTIKALERVVRVDDVKVGYWIYHDGDNAICSCCHRLNHLYGAYCKHCGEKMVVKQEGEE